MIVGILSDTHDRVDAMAAGMALLRQGGATFFIHCGDVGSERVLDHLAGTRAAIVFGNTDWDRAPLTRYAKRLDIACHPALAELELGGKQFAITHGDDAKLVRRLLDGQRHDYLLHGHTHVRADTRVGKIRIINPGALHRAKERTVALLDTETDKLKFLTVVL